MEINTHTLTPGNITVVNNTLKSDLISGKNVNYSNYDDTKIKERLSLLETEVSDITQLDANFNWRLQQLESIDHNQFATKTELQSVSDRVTRLENIPVGLPDDQIDEIFEM